MQITDIFWLGTMKHKLNSRLLCISWNMLSELNQ